MQNLKFVKPERILLAQHGELREKWVQDRIAEDPSILGLGELILKDKERVQPRAGRLDLLLQHPDLPRRYEGEIQLGATDESHIIRTIEYWDVERKRYPQYDHCAVIVAEDITSRFLNVIGLLNGTVPLIALQMSVLRIGENVSLVFTTVMSQFKLGMPDEDEEGQAPADRDYWENRATKASVSAADKLLEMIHSFSPGVQLKYNKFYIGLSKDGQADNFVIFRPKKFGLRIELWIPRSGELDAELEKAGLDVMDYDERWERYRLRLEEGDVKKHQDLLTRLLKQSYEHSRTR
jgi:hypothetical protein